jgi:hypothetical protein
MHQTMIGRMTCASGAMMLLQPTEVQKTMFSDDRQHCSIARTKTAGSARAAGQLGTFLQAIELLGDQRQPYEVRLIGIGEGDTSFGEHTLASFPTYDSPKGKRIAGPGSRGSSEPDVWPSRRSVWKIKSPTRSKSSAPIQLTPPTPERCHQKRRGGAPGMLSVDALLSGHSVRSRGLCGWSLS